MNFSEDDDNKYDEEGDSRSKKSDKTDGDGGKGKRVTLVIRDDNSPQHDEKSEADYHEEAAKLNKMMKPIEPYLRNHGKSIREVIQYVFNPSLDSGEVLIKLPWIDATRWALRTLYPGRPLSEQDQVFLLRSLTFAGKDGGFS